MAARDTVQGNDGHPARVSGPWAAEKLHYVENYQDIFATGMKDKWPARAYVDLMAGPGSCVEEDTEDEYPGSPVRSLSYPFTHRSFVELDPRMADALRARVEDPSSVITGNCNDPAVIAAVRTKIPENALTLVFVDNLGLNCTFQTLASLTDRRKMDLMITVMTSDLQRNLQRSEDRERFTAFFGSDGWREVVEQAAAVNKSPGETANDLLDYYGTRLATIGYSHYAPARRLMKNSRQSALYRLVLASKHERGEEFFRKIEKISYQGQRELFG